MHKANAISKSASDAELASFIAPDELIHHGMSPEALPPIKLCLYAKSASNNVWSSKYTASNIPYA
jgi:hypothetical protein